VNGDSGHISSSPIVDKGGTNRKKVRLLSTKIEDAQDVFVVLKAYGLFDSDTRPRTSDNRLNAGNGKRLHKDKGIAVSR
jgi:hypothetical protein